MTTLISQQRTLTTGNDREENPATPLSIAVVIPAFNVQREIEAVLRSIPAFVTHIIVVDDASRDNTPQVLESVAPADSRITVLTHACNQGVGGAMLTGFRKALELRAHIVAKVDGDGQMSPGELPNLLDPLLSGIADYTKGNRFHHFHALAQMPPLRRCGNMALSFLAKMATGYWNCFDPTNGFLAVRADVLSQLPLNRIAHSYFFETSMLAQLYLLGAVVHDVPIPACYNDERSNLSIKRVLGEFPVRLLSCLCRRLILRNFIYDFTMESVYLLTGLPMQLEASRHRRGP
jgi:dolichol-phosphate mannosyltransferase